MDHVIIQDRGSECLVSGVVTCGGEGGKHVRHVVEVDLLEGGWGPRGFVVLVDKQCTHTFGKVIAVGL